MQECQLLLGSISCATCAGPDTAVNTLDDDIGVAVEFEDEDEDEENDDEADEIMVGLPPPPPLQTCMGPRVFDPVTWCLPCNLTRSSTCSVSTLCAPCPMPHTEQLTSQVTKVGQLRQSVCALHQGCLAADGGLSASMSCH